MKPCLTGLFLAATCFLVSSVADAQGSAPAPQTPRSSASPSGGPDTERYLRFPRDDLPNLVPDREVNAASVGAGARKLLDQELAPLKLRTVRKRPVKIGNKYICNYRIEYSDGDRVIPLAATSSVLCTATRGGRALDLQFVRVPRRLDRTDAEIGGDRAVQAAVADFKQRSGGGEGKPGDPQPEIWVDDRGDGRLCWTLAVTGDPSASNRQALRYWISAVGEPRVVAVRGLVHDDCHGTVTGSIYETPPFDVPVSRPLGHVQISRDTPGATVESTPDGTFTLSGSGQARLTANLVGPYCVILDRAGQDDDAAGPVLSLTVPGDDHSTLNFHFEATNDHQKAQLNAFYSVNAARDFAGDLLTPGDLPRLRTRVNWKATCNADFNQPGGLLPNENEPSLRFFVAGGGCANTAYPDLVYHEYGHAIDYAKGGILDGQYSEGFGDCLVILMTRQPIVGRRFLDSEPPVLQLGYLPRDARNPAAVWTSSSPFAEQHAAGQVYAGFAWDLIQELKKATRSEDEAFAVAKDLIFGAAAKNPDSIPKAVLESLRLDDDDNDLSNGTPHSAQLVAAAKGRGIPLGPQSGTLIEATPLPSGTFATPRSAEGSRPPIVGPQVRGVQPSKLWARQPARQPLHPGHRLWFGCSPRRMCCLGLFGRR